MAHHRKTFNVSKQYLRGYRSNLFPTDTLRIAYVADTGAEGEFEWFINNRRYLVKAGDMLLFHPADLRMPLLGTRDENVLIYVLNFYPDTALVGATLSDLYYAFARLSYIPADKAAPLLPHFERIRAELDRKDDPLAEDAAKAVLRLFLIDLIRVSRTELADHDAVPAKTVLSHARLIAGVIAYLRRHLSERLTIGEVAAEFNISESSLSKIFRGTLGMTFPEYIRRMRVMRVIDIVCDGSTGVLDAAMEAGFTSISGFYKSFSAITGTTPSEFINIAKNC